MINEREYFLFILVLLQRMYAAERRRGAPVVGLAELMRNKKALIFEN